MTGGGSGWWVDDEDKEGCTPLHLACRSENEILVKFLLEKGADVEKRNKNGHTPLHIAVAFSSLSIVSLLLAHHPSPLSPSPGGLISSPLSLSLSSRPSLLSVIKGEEGGKEREDEEKKVLSPFMLSMLYDGVWVKCKLVGEKGDEEGEKGGEEVGSGKKWVTVEVFPFDSLRSVKSKILKSAGKNTTKTNNNSTLLLVKANEVQKRENKEEKGKEREKEKRVVLKEEDELWGKLNVAQIHIILGLAVKLELVEAEELQNYLDEKNSELRF